MVLHSRVPPREIKMNLTRHLKTLLVRYGIGAVLAVAAGFVVLFSSTPGQKVINASYDLLFINCGLPFLQPKLTKPTEAVMVWQDEDSYTQLNQLHTMWDRAVYAQLLDRLTAEGARAAVFDVMFTETNTLNLEGDVAFARAIKANGKVVLPADFYYTADGSPTVDRAIDPFFDAAAGWGIAQLDTDEDLTVRRQLHVHPDPNAEQFSSMSWEAARLLGVPETDRPENRSTRRWMNYYGPPAYVFVKEDKTTEKIPGTIPGVSFWQAIETNAFCPAGFFSNKVVFIGSNIKTYFAKDRKDEYRSPYTGNRFIPGVEVQTTEFLNLLRHDWLTRSTFVQEKWMVLLAGLVLGIGLTRFRPMIATGLALLAAVLVTAFAHYLFWHHRIWFPWLIIVAVQVPIAWAWSILYNSLSAYVQNKLLEQSLGLYLSPKQVQRILKEPGLRQPGGSKQVVSILFSDIAGFSRISEQLDPQELVQLLNAYYETTIRCIHKTDGTIVDIIGDAIFAIWNAPELQPDHQEKMLQAALAFQQNVTNFNGKQGSLALRTRVGLHTGEVVVGNVGSTEHFDFTAIGENVNLASRLEGLNKQLGTDVLLTPAALPAATENYSLRPVGKFQFKGFESFVEVVELVVNAGSVEQTRAWRESFAAALAEFGRKNFDAAEAGFKHTQELRADDGPSNFYLKQIADLRTHVLPENWAGEISLKEK